MIFWISIGFNVLFLAAICVFIYALNRSGQTINEYEQFYDDSISEIEAHLTNFQRLMNDNVILSDDESVKQCFRSIESFYSTMVSYHNARRDKSRDIKKLF